MRVQDRIAPASPKLPGPRELRLTRNGDVGVAGWWCDEGSRDKKVQQIARHNGKRKRNGVRAVAKYIREVSRNRKGIGAIFSEADEEPTRACSGASHRYRNV